MPGKAACRLLQARCGRTTLGLYAPRQGRRRAAQLVPASSNTKPYQTEMGEQVVRVLYGVAMAAVIVGVDFVFFRNRFWERLTVNIGIVLVFGAFYLRIPHASMNRAR